MAEHDNGYKRLFSHPEMVADLLRGFVREDWVQDLDFSTRWRGSPGATSPRSCAVEESGPEDIQRVLLALIEWLREPELAELRRSFTTWLLGVLLPARVPGIVIPQVADLQEVKSMLAERVMEWTEQWKQEGFQAGFQEGFQAGFQEGFQEGLQEVLERARGVLLRDLERRFGSLPEEVRRRVEAIASIEDLTEFSLRAGAAPSFAALAVL